MKFGVCTAIENAALLKSTGFDFIELNVQSFLTPRKSDAEFAEVRDALKKAGLPAVAANVMLPGDLKVCGPEYDAEALKSYLATVCARAKEAGLEKIVFGSGGARRIPDGFDREKAKAQLREFGGMLAKAAAGKGITITVEPLNQAECNVLTSVGEAAEYVGQVNEPSFKLLVDLFHFMKDDNDLDALAKAMPLIKHVHIATFPNRKAPSIEPTDFSKAVAVLKKARYDGSVSIEGGWNDIAKEAAPALAELRRVFA